MTNRNLPSLQDIAGGASLAGLSVDALDALLSEAETQNKLISAAKRAITAHIETTYAGGIAAAYNAKGADFGSVRLSEGGYEIVVDTPKKVEWDGEKVAAIGDAMVAAGDDPSEYIRVSYAVDERKFAAWPAHIRTVFEPARTVRPGSRTVKLVRKEAA